MATESGPGTEAGLDGIPRRGCNDIHGSAARAHPKYGRLSLNIIAVTCHYRRGRAAFRRGSGARDCKTDCRERGTTDITTTIPWISFSANFRNCNQARIDNSVLRDASSNLTAKPLSRSLLSLAERGDKRSQLPFRGFVSANFCNSNQARVDKPVLRDASSDLAAKLLPRSSSLRIFRTSPVPRLRINDRNRCLPEEA